MNFGQVITAMVTPFDKNENIAWDEVTRITEWLIETGSDGIVVAGTTGESPALTVEEKIALFRHVARTANGRATVIAGTGSNSTAATVELTKQASECGVDGILLVAPYYNKPSQAGLYEHFRTVAAATELPIMLYNIPGRTGVNMSADTVVRLAEISNIVAIKEASGDFVQASDIVRRTPDDFYLYSGDDKNTLPLMAVGAHGVVSVASHLIGNEMKQMVAAFTAGDHQAARALHEQWLDVFEDLFIAPNPVPVKYALAALGYGDERVRLPLVPATEQQKIELAQIVKKVRAR
ncbi:4-hydroxy-tetrahydrodipicolinate synthase [Numidum massiliense]|uniref:4-hydroxy-tetrahydrodipicolinate synthase n=1 Tax=Numidum massiliense TaxID=1522315 RepID=UPI000A6EB631|nr:4-hydroxy-tetrahydrodipicolinate synthase [Numidum massiliense]